MVNAAAPTKSRLRQLRRNQIDPVVTSLEKLGTTWKVVNGEVIVLQMYDLTAHDPDAVAAAKCWKRQGFEARPAIPDDFPPEVPEGLVILGVPLAMFDAFLQTFLEKRAIEDQYIYARIEDVWSHDAGEVTYEDLPVGKALLTFTPAL